MGKSSVMQYYSTADFQEAVDYMKFKSSMTLFALAASEREVFGRFALMEE